MKHYSLILVFLIVIEFAAEVTAIKRRRPPCLGNRCVIQVVPPKRQTQDPVPPPEPLVGFMNSVMIELKEAIYQLNSFLPDTHPQAKVYLDLKGPLIDLLNEEFSELSKQVFKDICRPPQHSWGSRGSADMGTAYKSHFEQCSKLMPAELEKASTEKLTSLSIPKEAYVQGKINPDIYPVDPRKPLQESLPLLSKQIELVEEGIKKGDPESILAAGQALTMAHSHAIELLMDYNDLTTNYGNMLKAVNDFNAERKKQNAIIIATTVFGIVSFLLTPFMGSIFKSIGGVLSTLFGTSARTAGMFSQILRPVTAAVSQVMNSQTFQALKAITSIISNTYKAINTPLDAVNQLDDPKEQFTDKIK